MYHAVRSGGEETARLAQDAMDALPIELVEKNINIRWMSR